MVKWTISIVPSAMAEQYKIPRGSAADVTAAISALGKNQKPQASQQIEGRPETYTIMVKGYTVEYELIIAERIVKVLAITSQ